MIYYLVQDSMNLVFLSLTVYSHLFQWKKKLTRLIFFQLFYWLREINIWAMKDFFVIDIDADDDYNNDDYINIDDDDDMKIDSYPCICIFFGAFVNHVGLMVNLGDLNRTTDLGILSCFLLSYNK